MYAIVDIAGQQFKVEKDQKLYVHRLEVAEGKKVSFDKVMLIDTGSKVSVGDPLVKGASVSARILAHVKGDKVLVFKKKRRKGYKKLNGHRQYLTRIQIEGIAEKAAKKETPEAKKETPEAKATPTKKSASAKTSTARKPAAAPKTTTAKKPAETGTKTKTAAAKTTTAKAATTKTAAAKAATTQAASTKAASTKAASTKAASTKTKTAGKPASKAAPKKESGEKEN